MILSGFCKKFINGANLVDIRIQATLWHPLKVVTAAALFLVLDRGCLPYGIFHLILWCGAVMGSFIFLSAHILDHLEEEGRAGVVFKQSFNYGHGIRDRYPDKHFEVIRVVDANVGFPECFEDISGAATLPLRPSRTLAKIRSVASWAEGLSLSALSTFQKSGS